MVRRARDIEIEIPRSSRWPLALDKRSFDSDRRLTITDCVISASQVNPYIGAEIPDWQALGLDPDALYPMYRDPAALKAAMPGLNGKPLLIEHASVSAADPKQHLQVGTVFDCRWANDRILGTVSVWDENAIHGIETNVQRDLSAGYRYTPKMTPGVANGESFAGRMVAIEFQHVALVPQGRVSGAQVGDAAPTRYPLTRVIPGYGRLR